MWRHMARSAEKKYEQPERHDFCISGRTVVRAHKISALHSQSKFDAMVWSNILLIVSTSLQSKGSALASFSWQFNSEAKFYTHASVPGCSAPNALLLPATASQSKGSALAALAWQRGQHVHRHQSIRTLSSQHPSFCFHCIMKQVLRLGKFLLAVQKGGQVVEHWSH